MTDRWKCRQDEHGVAAAQRLAHVVGVAQIALDSFRWAAQPRMLGRKANEGFAVLSSALVHRVGNEAAWWRDPRSILPRQALGRLVRGYESGIERV
jgi:hypothetical protein